MKRLAILTILLLGACGHPAAAPVHPTLPEVTLCKTTEAELRAALGTPTRDGLFHSARVMSWIVDGSGGVIRYLAVMLDGNSVVIDRVWNIPTEIPWTPTDQCAR